MGNANKTAIPPLFLHFFPCCLPHSENNKLSLLKGRRMGCIYNLIIFIMFLFGGGNNFFNYILFNFSEAVNHLQAPTVPPGSP